MDKTRLQLDFWGLAILCKLSEGGWAAVFGVLAALCVFGLIFLPED
jgi:hypothetical protein